MNNNNSNINEEDENKQINMFEYIRETTKELVNSLFFIV